MKPPRPHDGGNALFIILIAVALFAALSYAVTQSGRDGASVDKERTTLDAAQLMQYAALMRSTVQRMVLTGTNPGDLIFCSSGPGTFCEIDDDDVCTSGVDCVFAPEGGGMPPAQRYIHPKCNSGALISPAGGCPWLIDANDTLGWSFFGPWGTAAPDTILFLFDIPGDLQVEVLRRQFGDGPYDFNVDEVDFKVVNDGFLFRDLAIVLVVR